METQEIEKETGTYIIPVPQAKITPFHIPDEAQHLQKKEKLVKERKHNKKQKKKLVHISYQFHKPRSRHFIFPDKEQNLHKKEKVVKEGKPNKK